MPHTVVRLALATALSLTAVHLEPAAQARPWAGEPTYLPAAQVVEFQVQAADPGHLRVELEIAQGYYLYRDQFAASDASGRALALTLPPGTARHDASYGDTRVYEGRQTLTIETPAQPEISLRWQGCAEGGICYPPQTHTLRVPTGSSRTPAHALQPASSPAAATPASMAVAGPPSAAGAAQTQTNGGPMAAQDQSLAARLRQAPLPLSLALFFGMGLLLAFTPCSLPMLPIVSSLVVGRQRSMRRTALLAGTYVLAMALTYALLGVIAGLAGAGLQASLQHPVILSAFAGVFVILALSLFGAFELQLPASLSRRLDGLGRNSQAGKLAGAAVLGVLSAALVGPCMTAPLAGALLFLSQSGSAMVGGAALFALGLGMGLPLILVATLGARVLPRPGPWMDVIRVAFGAVMLAVAISMLARFLDPSSVQALWGAWLLLVAVLLVAREQAGASRGLRRWAPRYLAGICLLCGVSLLVGALAGNSDPLRPLQVFAGTADSTPSSQAGAPLRFEEPADVTALDQAVAQAGKRAQWTLVDVYADWCVSCKVIEREVFGDPRVQARLSGMTLLRPDVTENDARDQALMSRHGIAGPPTLMLIGPDGHERRQLRMVGETSAEDFLARLDAAGVGR